MEVDVTVQQTARRGEARDDRAVEQLLGGQGGSSEFNLQVASFAEEQPEG